MKSKIWNFFNSNIFLLVGGFFLSGFVGHYLTVGYQDSSWERDQKYEVFKQEIDEVKKTLETVTLHISSRTYSLQKVHWELESGDIAGANKEYCKYIELKDNWNMKVRIYRNKLKRLVDSELAFLLLDEHNSANISKNPSVHASFADAHFRTRLWMKCAKKTNCNEISNKRAAAHSSLKKLFEVTDNFIDKAYSIFLNKYKEMQRSPEKLTK